MNDNMIVASLKLVYKPLITYNGEWKLIDGLKDISLEKRNKNLYDEFLNRYYYMPLSVILKDEELANSFGVDIISKESIMERNLYFSKNTFLKNIVPDIDELVLNNGDIIYKEIKQAIRKQKDMYRDVFKNGEESIYYENIKNEYIMCELDVSLEEFVLLCKKKYTRLLSGYNAILDFFDKPINLDKFIKCFDVNKLYLLTAYSLLKNSEKHFDSYGKIDYNVVVLDTYKKLVDDFRKEDSFYNSYIMLDDNIVYTIDDLFKEYNVFLEKTNEL